MTTEGAELVQGWYLPTRRLTPPRWVLAIGNGHVYYSRGGVTHFECLEKTMIRWIKRTAARLESPQVKSNEERV